MANPSKTPLTEGAKFLARRLSESSSIYVVRVEFAEALESCVLELNESIKILQMKYEESLKKMAER